MVGYVKNGTMGAMMEKLKKYRYPALILALGVVLLLLPAGVSGDRTEESEPAAQTEFDLTEFTRAAEALLSQVQGAGEVKLLLSLETGGTRDFLMDRSQRRSGEDLESQSQAVLTGSGSGQAAVQVEQRYPEFRGAVVLSRGADSSEVTLALKEALSSLTGLGLDKITVCKMD